MAFNPVESIEEQGKKLGLSKEEIEAVKKDYESQQASQAQSPEQYMAQLSQMVGPMVQMADSLIPEMARLQMKYYKQLKKAGFSDDQAIQIVCASNLMGRSTP